MTKNQFIDHLRSEGRTVFSEDGEWTNGVRSIYSFVLGAVLRDCDRLVLEELGVTYLKGESVVLQQQWRITAKPTLIRTLFKVLAADPLLSKFVHANLMKKEKKATVTIDPFE
jgi:hypothetical protein